MSGILGLLVGQLTASEQDNAEGVHSALQDVLGLNQAGGIAGLLEQFAGNGLQEHVQSWIGSGSNLPITADQVQQVLSNDQVQAMIERTGLPVDALLPLVAKMLPHAVDQATPAGAASV
jgi:uncharacterized protein YidB (DUF937 family)